MKARLITADKQSYECDFPEVKSLGLLTAILSKCLRDKSFILLESHGVSLNPGAILRAEEVPEPEPNLIVAV